MFHPDLDMLSIENTTDERTWDPRLNNIFCNGAIGVASIVSPSCQPSPIDEVVIWLCHSHSLSHFAAFFIDARTKSSVVEEKGRSGDTFFAVKMYMHLYHPKLVILENVMGATWTDESPAAQKKDQINIA
jgi:hypothetical protein